LHPSRPALPPIPTQGSCHPRGVQAPGASRDLCLDTRGLATSARTSPEGHSEGRDFSVVMCRRAGRESVRAPCQGDAHEALSRLGGSKSSLFAAECSFGVLRIWRKRCGSFGLWWGWWLGGCRTLVGASKAHWGTRQHPDRDVGVQGSDWSVRWCWVAWRRWRSASARPVRPSGSCPSCLWPLS
jgi:hypothetical protein